MFLWKLLSLFYVHTYQSLPNEYIYESYKLKDETNTATIKDTSNNSMEQDVNTNIDDYTQGIVNSEYSDVSYAQENLPNDALDQNSLAYDNSAERTNENIYLDSARVADNNSDKSDNNDCSAITIRDDTNSTVEDLDANFCESISNIGTSTASNSKDTKGRMFVS